MQNVTIKAKLIFSFLALLVIIIGLGGLAVNRLSNINDHASEIRNNWLPSVGAIGKLSSKMEIGRIYTFRIAMAPDTEVAKEIELARKASLEIDAAYKAYEPMITKGSEDERLMGIFAKKWPEYQKLVERAMKAKEAGDDATALKLLNVDSKNVMDEIRATLAADVQYNQQEGIKAGKDGEEVYRQTETIVYTVITIAVLLTIALTFFIINNVAQPITYMTSAMEKLGAGDKTIKIPGLDRSDEIGGMAHALEVFKNTAIEAERLSGISAKEQAAKEARQKKIEGYIALFQKEATEAMSQLASAATEMRATAESMSATAEETSRQSTAVAAASEEASASVSTVASAAEELTASITEIQRQTEASQKTADQAVIQAKSTEDTVRGLEAATVKITDVMSLISEIASQTNLLALNATIEAARAGEAGKGFAVVASEVKNLAGQTAKATEEVGSQIVTMQNATKGVVEAIQKISTTIDHMNKMAADIAHIVQQQGSAVHEIAHNAQQASAGTQEVSSNIVGVNRAAADTGAAATQVLGTAGELSKQSTSLKMQIDSFLEKIQTA